MNTKIIAHKRRLVNHFCNFLSRFAALCGAYTVYFENGDEYTFSISPDRKYPIAPVFCHGILAFACLKLYNICEENQSASEDIP